MSEPVEMIAEDARRKADQALLLARIFASVVTMLLILLGAVSGSSAARYGTMFAELGIDAELPVISRLVTRYGTVLMLALPLLGGVTGFFIWAKGRASAWMAGFGLLLLAMLQIITWVALTLPLLRIMTSLGNV
jgi:hypothetical protein